MQDEDIDKLVRDAASQHHPPYDDTAWDKMEQLLDKHLPQKKDRRRPFLLLLLTLLLTGGAFYALIYPGTGRFNKQDKIMAQNTRAVNSPSAQQEPTAALPAGTTQTGSSTTATQPTSPANPAGNNGATGSTTNITVIKNTGQGQPPTAQAGNGDDAADTRTAATYKKKGRAKMRITNATAKDDDMAGNSRFKHKPGTKKQSSTAGENESDDNSTVITAQKDNTVITTTAVAAQALPTGTDKKTLPAPADSTAMAKKEVKKIPDTSTTTATAKKEDKRKGKLPGNFGITVSAGTDLSFVDISTLGKATFLYGAGISYDIRRFKLRTGFYVSDKIYSAAPYEYNGTIYPNLVGIDGNCKVYEIPVSVSYNFGQAKKHNWFVGAGLSSFIMKRENYVYNYKTPAGNTYTHKQELDNKNRHLFSVLNLSAGYQYAISNRVSVMAEPFVKLPLTGLGQGKIKLNSTGILLTATVKPFNKKKH